MDALVRTREQAGVSEGPTPYGNGSKSGHSFLPFLAMSASSLFSTYRQGENRVTSSMLAVLSRLDLSRLERLLSGAMGETTLQLVRFENQPTTGASATVPDGRISAAFSLWIEVKTERNALRENQLRGHLGHLDGESGLVERLLVITPDADEPRVISELGDARVVWFSFRDLSDAIDDLMADETEVVSDREALLLREFQKMLDEDGLLAAPVDVAVVAAKDAYPEYLERSAYICQPHRPFRPGVRYLGFYRHKRIELYFPKILHVWEAVPITSEGVEQLRREGGTFAERAARLVEEDIKSGIRRPVPHKIMLLSGPDDPETLRRESPIRHDGTGAWTQGQRYAKSQQLLTAEATSDLD